LLPVHDSASSACDGIPPAIPSMNHGHTDGAIRKKERGENEIVLEHIRASIRKSKKRTNSLEAARNQTKD
jgi:hypothetical protein